MTDYVYKTKPYPHQEREFMRSRDAKTWALFLEQRTGKTKVVLDTVAWNYQNGRIDALLVIAPPGVHIQWAMDEIPLHLPNRIPWVTLIWRTGRAPKKFQEDLEQSLKTKALLVLVMNTQALITKQGKLTVSKFLKHRKVLWAFDESADIRTPSAKTTQTAITLGRRAVMRRVLAGVPAPEGPMDLYSQYKFLHPGIIGAKNFLEYKLTYAEWIILERNTMRRINPEQAFIAGRLRKGLFMLPKKDKHDKPIYKNLGKLEEKTAWRTSRVTQREAFPNMPEKQYQRFYVDLDPEQLRIYNQLAEEYFATLEGRILEVPLLITRFIRLQQIISGYLPLPLEIDLDPDFDFFSPFDGNKDIKVKYEIVRIPGAESRVAMLDEILARRAGDPAIVWCRFKPDIDMLMEHFKKKEILAERYDGSVKQEVRENIKREFGLGNIPILIGNQQAGGTGLTLKPAQTAVYFSNYFGLLQRLQSEDRPIHGELQRPVLYADIVARTTLEEKLVNSLQNKRDIFQELMGDRKRIEDWFRKAT